VSVLVGVENKVVDTSRVKALLVFREGVCTEQGFDLSLAKG
jgi:hypothetical protein